MVCSMPNERRNVPREPGLVVIHTTMAAWHSNRAPFSYDLAFSTR
jgi:hypothetical protein